MLTIPEVYGEALPACPACGADNWKQAGQVKDYSVSGEWFELKECANCGLRMTWPQPEANKIGKYYASSAYISHSDTKSGLTNRLYHKAREFMLKKKFSWVSQASGKSKGTLLDVGAGTGYFAHYMQSQGWNVVALEPDENARKVAAAKLNLQLLPLESLAKQEALHFDVITLWHVLEHVHDIRGYIDHFHSILKDDGSLIIAVPNYTSGDAKKYKQKWAAFDVPRHLWHFTPKAMESLLQNHGFQVTEKMNMPLDAFYVSMLSEKYNANYFFGPMAGFWSGLRSFMKSRKNVDRASSIIYVANKIRPAR